MIRNITGENPLFYRPPGGNLNQDIIDTAHQRAMRVLKWGVDPKDYTTRKQGILTTEAKDMWMPAAS